MIKINGEVVMETETEWGYGSHDTDTQTDRIIAAESEEEARFAASLLGTPLFQRTYYYTAWTAK